MAGLDLSSASARATDERTRERLQAVVTELDETIRELCGTVYARDALEEATFLTRFANSVTIVHGRHTLRARTLSARTWRRRREISRDARGGSLARHRGRADILREQLINQ